MFDDDLAYAKDQLGIQFDLKDRQVEALQSLYKGHDTIAVLPTGYGKSLIYQLLPWLLQKARQADRPLITIIATPINAIMMDQVRSLAARGVSACYVDFTGSKCTSFNDSADHDASDEEETLSSTDVKMCDILQGRFNLIYAHPETLTESREFGKVMRNKSLRKLVCCTVVDEVHMISEWGPEFRKSFQKLGELTCLFPRIPHLAVTATATKENIENLSSVLQFENSTFIISNPDRPNIYLEIRERLPNINKFEKYDAILSDICSELKTKLQSFPVTIVYCDNLESVGYSYLYISSEIGSEQYYPSSDPVPENRIFAQYHKEYTENMKKHIIFELQKKEPKLRLVFATVALGMGLNAPSIERIIHFRPPTTIEKYFQEIGRAGRSLQPAQAIMYYNNSDIASNRKGLSEDMKKYVRSSVCLRRRVLHYFGFENILYEGQPENCCSNCRKKKLTIDLSN